MSDKLYRPEDAEKLAKLHPDLKAVVLKFVELGGRFIIIETERGKAAQTKAHNTGHSNATFGKSPHNFRPALAVDLGPTNYPGKIGDYHNLAIGMFAAARELNIGITWGGDWKSLKDWPHFELKNWKNIKGTLAS